MATLLIIIFITLVLSAFFSGSEIAFVSANKLGVEVMRNKGDQKGKILANFYERPKDFLGTMLVGNNIALVIFTMFMTDLIEPWLQPFLGNDSVVLLLVVTLIITIVVLIFGEFLPKTLFRLYANELLFRLSYPLRFFKWLLAIPTWMMTGLSSFLLKSVFRIPTEDATNALTMIDLEHFINDSITEEEDIDKEILTNALNLKQVKVRDCMIPRNEIIHVDIKDSMDNLIDTFRSSKLSRIIVIDGDIENIKGYIHHQQLLYNPKNLKKIIMPIQFVPEAMNVQDLMLQFIKDNTSIGCVVDEFGSVAGLITLEDTLEEIFGEIEDEHDNEEHIEDQISEEEFLFSGRLEINYLNEKYPQLNLPEGDYHTLSGLLVMTEESIPEAGAEFEREGFTLRVESVSDTKIDTIRILIHSELNPEQNDKEQ